eukprot:36180-Eustigmatos_ZCMA.PRE.1
MNYALSVNCICIYRKVAGAAQGAHDCVWRGANQGLCEASIQSKAVRNLNTGGSQRDTLLEVTLSVEKYARYSFYIISALAVWDFIKTWQRTREVDEDKVVVE